MTENSIGDIVALVPYEMQRNMQHLRSTLVGVLTICDNADDFAKHSRERIYSVALIPASLPTPNGGTYGGCFQRWSRSHQYLCIR
jgi:hypothetical protein